MAWSEDDEFVPAPAAEQGFSWQGGLQGVSNGADVRVSPAVSPQSIDALQLVQVDDRQDVWKGHGLEGVLEGRAGQAASEGVVINVHGRSSVPEQTFGLDDQAALMRVDGDVDPRLMAQAEGLELSALLCFQGVSESVQDVLTGFRGEGVLVGLAEQVRELLAPGVQREGVHEGEAEISVEDEHDVVHPLERVHALGNGNGGHKTMLVGRESQKSCIASM